MQETEQYLYNYIMRTLIWPYKSHIPNYVTFLTSCEFAGKVLSSVGGNALQVMQSDYFFQVTNKVTYYFLIYKKILELLFQKSNASHFVFPVIDWQVSCPHVERNRKYRDDVCEHDVTVVLD